MLTNSLFVLISQSLVSEALICVIFMTISFAFLKISQDQELCNTIFFYLISFPLPCDLHNAPCFGNLHMLMLGAFCLFVVSECFSIFHECLFFFFFIFLILTILNNPELLKTKLSLFDLMTSSLAFTSQTIWRQ